MLGFIPTFLGKTLSWRGHAVMHHQATSSSPAPRDIRQAEFGPFFGGLWQEGFLNEQNSYTTC